MQTTKTNPSEIANDVLTGDLAVAFSYWNELRDGRIGPTWREFQLVRLPTSLIPWCGVADVFTDPLDFRFRFLGTERVALQGRDLTGCSVKELQPSPYADMIFRQKRDVVESKVAIHSVTRFDAIDENHGSFEMLRLPFSDDGVNVTAILSASSYNEVAIRHMYRVLGTNPQRFGP